MIIDKSNKFDKLIKKIMPQSFKVVVHFLSFINSDEETGLVLYKIDKWKPFSFEIPVQKIKKIKAKTYQELEQIVSKNFENSNNYIKKAKASFIENFDVNCNVKNIKEFNELELIDNTTIFNKHIVCVITDLDIIERSFDFDGCKCKIVPFNQIYQYDIEKWLLYFIEICNQNC